MPTKEEYKIDIIKTIKQINNWEEIKTCICSFYPTKVLVQAAINWEIWEEFRLIKYLHDDIIDNLVDIILKNEDNK